MSTCCCVAAHSSFFATRCWSLWRSPLRFLRTLGMALRQGYGSKSGVFRHLAYLVGSLCVAALAAAAKRAACPRAFWNQRGPRRDVVAIAGRARLTVLQCTGRKNLTTPRHLAARQDPHAAFVVAVSSFGRSQLYRLCEHSHWPRIHVVRCGIPRDYGDDLTSMLPVGNRFVCVGRLCEQKGQLLLIEAAHRLQEHGVDFELLLVGDGPMRRELESLVQPVRACSHTCTFAGWCSGDEVRRHMLSARAIVLAQLRGGLPVVLMEALGDAATGGHDLHRGHSGTRGCRLRMDYSRRAWTA